MDNNDYRPTALTSVVINCLEKSLVSLLRSDIDPLEDPLQFAYRHSKGTDDAVNSISHLILKHLEDSEAYARQLFVDFTSAFNMVQPHLMIQKTSQMNVNPFLIKWYYSFLTSRTQVVKINNTLSDPKITHTGAPHGCVSSPVLFILYTNVCVSSHMGNYIFKFSDDTAILSLLY